MIGFDNDGTPLTLAVCPMWYLAFSILFGALVALFLYFVIIARNYFMERVMMKPEGWVSCRTFNHFFLIYQSLNQQFSRVCAIPVPWLRWRPSCASRIYQLCEVTWRTVEQLKTKNIKKKHYLPLCHSMYTGPQGHKAFC